MEKREEQKGVRIKKEAPCSNNFWEARRQFEKDFEDVLNFIARRIGDRVRDTKRERAGIFKER